MIGIKLLGFEKTIAFLNEGMKNVNRESDKLLQEVAISTQQAIKRKITLNTGLAGLSEGTKLKRKRGKLQGEHIGAIPAYRGSTALIRSRAYIKSIAIKKVGGNRLGYTVYVKDGYAPESGGGMGHIPTYASKMESDQIITVDMTPRMLAYLHILWKGWTGTPVKHISDARNRKVIRKLTVRIPGRPVWEPAVNEHSKPALAAKLPGTLASMYRT